MPVGEAAPWCTAIDCGQWSDIRQADGAREAEREGQRRLYFEKHYLKINTTWSRDHRSGELGRTWLEAMPMRTTTRRRRLVPLPPPTTNRR